MTVLEKTRDEYVSLHEDDLGTQALVDYYDPKKK